MKLPPMPEPKSNWTQDIPIAGGGHVPAGKRWDEEAMRAYGSACYAAGMDRAAEVCDKERDAHERRALSGGEADRYEVAAKAAEDCADAIRAAMPPKP